jgi:hypothetical protein
MNTLIQEDNRNGFRTPIPDVMSEQFPKSRYSTFPTPYLRAPKTKSLVNPQLDDLRELLFLPAGLSTNTIFFATIGALVAAGGVAGMIVMDAANQFVTTGSYDGNLVLLLINVIFPTFSIVVLTPAKLTQLPVPPQNEIVIQ